MAQELYEYMIKKIQETVPVVQTGVFGAKMSVSLVNEGTFTIILDENTFKHKKDSISIYNNLTYERYGFFQSGLAGTREGGLEKAICI